MLLPSSATDLQILIADGDADFSASVADIIRNIQELSGINITITNTVDKTVEELETQIWHVIFIDAENSFPILDTKSLQRQITSHLRSPIIILLFHHKKVLPAKIFSNAKSYSFVRGDLDANLIEVIIRTAKENLRQSVLLETTISATNQHAIVAVTDPDGKIAYVNDRFCSISEYAREDLIGRDHRMLSSKTHSKEFFVEMWETIKSGRVWQGDIKNITRTGKVLWLQTTIIPFQNEAGVINRYVTVRTDVTAIRERHDQAVNQAVQSTNFLANVSHEIRTPLHVILGTANMLSENQEAEQSGLIHTIKTAASSLKTLVDDLLDYTKFGSQQFKLELLPAKVERFTEQLNVLFSDMARTKGINFQVAYAPPIPEFLIDPVRLHQILVNLVGNAIKFTSHGSVNVDIEFKSYGSGHGKLIINVSDTGIGISADALPYLFQPFVQADPTITRRFGGTGLGLSIVKSLVDLMSGSIDVKSVEGSGSTFTVQLPVLVSQVLDNPLPAAASSREGNYVVIDDDSLCRIVTVAILNKIGINAVPFEDGQSALDYIKSNTIRAVFVDNHLPDMSGKDVAKHIRALGGEFSTIPVIALTGDLPNNYDFKADGFTDWLVKPVNEAQFMESIDPH